MENRKIRVTIEEAARLYKENPSWTYKKAIEKAKEVIGNEEVEVMEKAN